MRKLTLLTTAAALVLALGHSASAQQSQYVLPVERGILESHLDLQYQFASRKISVPNDGGSLGLGGTQSTRYNTSLLSLEGQYAFASRLEVGVNVPFMSYDNATLTGSEGSASLKIGDILATAKVKAFAIGQTLGLAFYTNVWLPTHSGGGDRNWLWQLGGAAEAGLLGFKVGGGANLTNWALSDAEDVWFLGLNGYARAPLPILPLLSITAAVEYFNSLAPNGDENVLMITPGLEVSLAWFHVGAAARIATTDDAKLFVGGRAALLLNGGVRF